ncbi:Gfo/Idh/MocA family oxidoreductase [Bosea vestrisii]|uniref:Gfo/Idh/MocA family protein n=1 Tax=Bosea vestrisii TaxID=151416 RepID=UPI0024DFC4B8|nr:Gfo/Idh/MocA family oxidoreductase [Bosea vestrisii]WID96660.1 Gfo/Idh/MocA family oxidoreductase [Bosea vestrisii]
MKPLSIGLVGAGAIGRMHADVIAGSDFAAIAGVADPTEAGRLYCRERGLPWYASHRDLLAAGEAEALIVATPNQSHLEIGLAAIARGVPALIEKPVAVTVAEGEELSAASASAGVPVLVGHHRRHNPVIAKARELVSQGALGRLTNATVLYTFYKHDAYFDLAWRREPGGGPVLINLIHEIDLIRFVCGEIAAVQAVTSGRVRGLPVEDTAAVLLELENGALITVSLSDTAVTPWSWDLVSGELPNYPRQGKPVNSHFISGTEGSLALPSLDHWRYDGEKSWFADITQQTIPVERESPYQRQLRHLFEIVRHGAAPLIDAADATRTLKVTLAVQDAARQRQRLEMHFG